MAIRIYPNTKVYVVAPANTATGGPELLHQLVYHLRKDLGIDAYMYYVPSNYPDPVHPEYKLYNNPFVRDIEDTEENIVIVPEVATGIEVLGTYFKIRKVIWWLSVDNFYLSLFFRSKRNLFIPRLINKISDMIFKKRLIDIDEYAYKCISQNEFFYISQIKQIDFHFAQSWYAVSHLKEKEISGSKIFYLSDYLNSSFLNIKTNLAKKENIVAYNPKKGLSFTRRIIKHASGIKFIPIINMTRQKVIETLQRAKVYIDFGNHPGKDRLPRESAILGCCVITGKRGAAKYFKDVPIPEEYKFEDKEENIPLIVDKIRDCFKNFNLHLRNFEKYRETIRNEQEKFIQDLKCIFEIRDKEKPPQ